VTEKSLITLEKISPGVYPRVKRGAGSEALEGVEMTRRGLLQISTGAKEMSLAIECIERFAA
jgi:hypothetical protein